MALRLKTSHFCGISRHRDWQKFLEHTDKELYNSYTNIISKSKGCNANKDLMIITYNKLYEKGYGVAFEEFITRRFPYIIDGLPKKIIKEESKADRSAEEYREPALNKHKVFKMFNPKLLSFPQQKIIVSKPSTLLNNVEEFLKDKVGTDYLIVEDHAYIEYFDVKYASVVNKIKAEKRDIHLYRKKLERAKKLGSKKRNIDG